LQHCEVGSGQTLPAHPAGVKREPDERYLWLRYRTGGRKAQWGTEFHFPGIKVLPAGLLDWPAACNVGEYLDAAIDLARS